MSSIAIQRLAEERKDFKKNKPEGFYATPMKTETGETNLLKWKCLIPGKKDSIWAGGLYTVYITFTDDYPTSPPTAKFDPPLFHPNVFPSGTVCLSILKAEVGWSPTINIRTILLGIQDLMVNPNINDPAQREAFTMLRDNPTEYENKVREIAKLYAPEESA